MYLLEILEDRTANHYLGLQFSAGVGGALIGKTNKTKFKQTNKQPQKTQWLFLCLCFGSQLEGGTTGCFSGFQLTLWAVLWMGGAGL